MLSCDIARNIDASREAKFKGKYNHLLKIPVDQNNIYMRITIEGE